MPSKCVKTDHWKLKPCKPCIVASNLGIVEWLQLFGMSWRPSKFTSLKECSIVWSYRDLWEVSRIYVLILEELFSFELPKPIVYRTCKLNHMFDKHFRKITRFCTVLQMQFCRTDGEEASGFSLSFVLLCGHHAPRSAERRSQEKWQWGSPQTLLPASLVCQPPAVGTRHLSWKGPLGVTYSNTLPKKGNFRVKQWLINNKMKHSRNTRGKYVCWRTNGEFIRIS